MSKILSRKNAYLLMLIGSFFFCSLSQAADTLFIGGNTYKITPKFDVMASWFGENEPPAMKPIYPTGIEGIFCSSPIYPLLQKGDSYSPGKEDILIFDSLKNRVVPIGIFHLAVGKKCDVNAKIVDGMPLSKSNSLHFVSVEQFCTWVEASLNK